MFSRSQALFDQAQTHIPGGVNSPVRAFRHVGGTPVFFKKLKVPMLGMKTTTAILIMSVLGGR